MTNRRRTAVAGASLLGALALVGCNLDTKPSALVTVVSGSDTQHTEAQCHDIAATATALTECMETGKKPKVLKVSEGSTVDVGVEPSVEDWGIVYLLPGQDSFTESGRIKDKTFAKALTVPNGVFSEVDTVPLAVVHFNEDGTIGKAWTFELKQK